MPMRFDKVFRKPVLFLVAMTGSTGACGSRHNPILELPVTPLRLELKGHVVSDSGTPITAHPALARIARTGVADTMRRLVTPNDGAFRFDDLAPGTYAVDTRSIGYYRRRDT